MSAYLADHVLTPDGWMSDAVIVVDDEGTIAHVGRTGERDEGGGVSSAVPERIRGYVLPGLPNLHSHAFQRGMAGLAEVGSHQGDDFWGWRQVMYGFLQTLTPDHVEAISAFVYLEMLQAGFTSVAEFHYLHNAPGGQPYDEPAEMAQRIVRAAGDVGIGLTILPAVYAASDFGGAALTDSQARFGASARTVLDMIGTLRGEHSHPQVQVGLALHSLRAVPVEQMIDAVSGLERFDAELPIHIHLAEQILEVEGCLAWSGARPVAWLLDSADLHQRWCVIHATHMEDTETTRLAASKAVVGLCPATEANLGDGLFPLSSFMDAGGALGVGSDSNITVSPVEELRTLEYGQRLLHKRRNIGGSRPAGSTGARLYELALAGGAQAVARPVGALAAGKRADWVVLDADHADFVARRPERILDAWIFSGAVNPVCQVMCGGQWVVKDGHHAGEDRIRARYRETMREVLGATGPRRLR